VPKILFCLLIAVGMMFSCRTEKKTRLTTIDILHGLKTEKEFRLSEFVRDVEYVKLETSKECIFPFATFSVGGKYILAVNHNDPEQIFLFDREGKFIRKIGGKGKGPFEYTSLTTVVADPEETYILVNDYQRDIILKYDFGGEVIRSYKYKEKLDGEVSDILVKSSQEIYFRIDYPRLEKKNFYLIRKMDGEFNQIDSLLPVNTSLLQGNGFFWGGSDFYLNNGSIQFRQFSFDTLFGESKVGLVPRFIFPIGADHLPGPYLVSGLHKQMGEYTSINSFTELTGYLILNARITPKRGGVMIYNKSSGEICILKKYPPCPPDTLRRRYIINDVDGLINPNFISGKNGLFVVSHQIVDLKEQLESNCQEIKEIKFPEKRQEFIDLINASKEDDNPILQIFHLKL
jgi:hypothetical protein